MIGIDKWTTEDEFRVDTGNAERNILTCLLKKPRMIYEIQDQIPKEYFKEQHNRALYSVLLYMAQKEDMTESEFDLMSVDAIVKKYEDIQTAFYNVWGKNAREDFKQYFLALKKRGSLAEPKNIGIYISELTKANAANEMLEKDDEFERTLKNNYNEMELEEITTKKETMTLEVVNKYFVTNNDPQKNKEEIMDRFANREYIPNGFVGHPTPFPQLNNFSKGILRKGSVTIINAGTNVGKSMVLKQIAKYLAIDRNIPIYLGATEQTLDEQENRIITELTGIDTGILENAMYNCPNEYFEFGKKRYKTKDIKEKVFEAAEIIKKSPLYIDKMDKYSPEKLKQRARFFKMRYGIEGFIWDYVKLMTGRDIELRHYLGEIVNTMKEDIANPLDIFCLSASQAKTYQWELSKESAEIEDFSTVFLCLRPLTQKEKDMNPMGGEYGFFLKKNRGGKKHKDKDNDFITLGFNEKKLYFYET